MEQILMATRPEHLVKILNGKQTVIALRKIPKNFVGWVNLCCTKEAPYLCVDEVMDINDELYCPDKGKYYYLSADNFWRNYQRDPISVVLNSTVVARFWFAVYEKIEFFKVFDHFSGGVYYSYKTIGLKEKELSEKSNIAIDELREYVGGYAVYLENLQIFDEPKKLSDFFTIEVEKLGRTEIKRKYLLGLERR